MILVSPLYNSEGLGFRVLNPTSPSSPSLPHMRTCVSLGARAGAREEVDVSPDELQVLQPVLGALRAAEAEYGRPRLNPADVHLDRQPRPFNNTLSSTHWRVQLGS